MCGSPHIHSERCDSTGGKLSRRKALIVICWRRILNGRTSGTGLGGSGNIPRALGRTLDFSLQCALSTAAPRRHRVCVGWRFHAYSPNNYSPSIARKGRETRRKDANEEDCSNLNLNTYVGRAEDRPVRLVDEALSLRTRRRATLSSFDQDEADTLHRWRRQKMGEKVPACDSSKHTWTREKREDCHHAQILITLLPNTPFQPSGSFWKLKIKQQTRFAPSEAGYA